MIQLNSIIRGNSLEINVIIYVTKTTNLKFNLQVWFGNLLLFCYVIYCVFMPMEFSIKIEREQRSKPLKLMLTPRE